MKCPECGSSKYRKGYTPDRTACWYTCFCCGHESEKEYTGEYESPFIEDYEDDDENENGCNMTCSCPNCGNTDLSVYEDIFGDTRYHCSNCDGDYSDDEVDWDDDDDDDCVCPNCGSSDMVEFEDDYGETRYHCNNCDGDYSDEEVDCGDDDDDDDDDWNDDDDDDDWDDDDDEY